ncbi:MAG: peptide-methionine (S)-S-oxide reductase MsrA [Burkholderiaceae bacterium]
MKRLSILVLSSLAALSFSPAAMAATATAVFAGGCFWSMEYDFEKLPGVLAAESGYAGGTVANPTYEQVSRGNTGHAEAVKVSYDTARLSYAQVLDYYWHHIDPTVKDQQFCDKGNEYRTVIFYGDDEQKKAAFASRDALLKTGKFKHIHTEIIPAAPFYKAEAYHQDYARKNPVHYHAYRTGCGRDRRIADVWGK